eukprot:887683-Alexandrium_andersonii.AAC.1
MSASLVGSEMCIRDRELASLLGASAIGSRPVLRHPPAVFRTCLLGNPETVSYTHLTLPTICSV